MYIQTPFWEFISEYCQNTAQKSILRRFCWQGMNCQLKILFNTRIKFTVPLVNRYEFHSQHCFDINLKYYRLLHVAAHHLAECTEYCSNANLTREISEGFLNSMQNCKRNYEPRTTSHVAFTASNTPLTQFPLKYTDKYLHTHVIVNTFYQSPVEHLEALVLWIQKMVQQTFKFSWCWKFHVNISWFFIINIISSAFPLDRVCLRLTNNSEPLFHVKRHIQFWSRNKMCIFSHTKWVMIGIWWKHLHSLLIQLQNARKWIKRPVTQDFDSEAG